MASSNRHWPSMFKSKPSNTTDHHHQLGFLPGCEQRTPPEPKPRWNPRPEQIRILEAIFNSGMANPPRDEIRKIRAQLQQYGQVGDANVFYWFQNRKSRSKHKHRQLPHNNNTNKSQPSIVTAPSSWTSSSDNPILSPNNSNYEKAALSISSSAVIDLFSNSTQGFCFPNVSCVSDRNVGNCSNVPLEKDVEDEMIKTQQQYVTNAPNNIADHDPIVTQLLSVQAPNNHVLRGADLGEPISPTKTSTVFINDVCCEVTMGPFNVRETFGDDAVLLQSSGQPVVTNEWGLTQQPLQHGAFYYLLRPFMPISSPDDKTIEYLV